jgi:hypothetical protein
MYDFENLPIFSNFKGNVDIIMKHFMAYNIEHTLDDIYIFTKFTFVLNDYTLNCYLTMTTKLYKKKIEIIGVNMKIKIVKLPKFNHYKILQYVFENWEKRFILGYHETLDDFCNNIIDLLRKETNNFFINQETLEKLNKCFIDCENNLVRN